MEASRKRPQKVGQRSRRDVRGEFRADELPRGPQWHHCGEELARHRTAPSTRQIRHQFLTAQVACSTDRNSKGLAAVSGPCHIF